VGRPEAHEEIRSAETTKLRPVTGP
jgi:hypothetical protein